MRKIVYMEWVKLKPRAECEIGGSGVAHVKIAEWPEARDAIDINDFNLYGYRPLLQQIARRYDVGQDQVVTVPGCSMANYLACAALLRPGDEVLIEKPAYEPLLSVARLLGAKVKRFARPFHRGFQIDVNELASKLTRKTRLIVLTNMHNPSGVLTSNDILREIGRLARRVGAHVLVDEVYLDFLFERRPPSAVHLGENFVVTSSLTKVYGFDGLRCGWILAAPKLAEAMWRLEDFFGVNGAIPAEKISTAAFENISRFEERTRNAVEANRKLVDEFMASHADRLQWVPPDGGPVGFPRLLGAENGWDFAERLFRDYSTRVIPGKFFEMPRHFRLGFGGDAAMLKTGLARLSSALNTAS
jgi:aspartate/methionine/tyrosine aminotransferase